MPVAKGVAQDIPFALVHYQDGSALIGATVTPYRCLDGGLQISAAGTVSELGNGQYLFNGSDADFDANFTTGLLFTSADAVPAHIVMQMTYFRKSTAYNIPFLLLNVNTSKGLTGASPSGKRCLDGGSQANVTGTFVERGNGQYVFQATAADFNADNVVGFLITAAGAVPIHIIIDLLESYTETSVLTDTPAAVLANYVTGLALMTVPSAGGDWPLYVASLPDLPDQSGVVYNTTPMKDARIMDGGGVVQHYGVEFILRSLSEEVGWDKCNIIAGALDTVHNVQTILTGITYEIHNISRVGGISSLGEEAGTKRRNLFSMNFLVSMTKL